MKSARALLVMPFWLFGCQAALDQRLDLVTDTRVIAIVSQPPEVLPGSDVAVSALVVGPGGVIAEMPAWSLCDAPKPPTTDDAVADGCVEDQVTPIPDPTMALIPMDACQTYGPDVTTTGFRPRDPDSTGGYYQPVRAQVPDIDLAFGFTRITCNLAAAPGEIAHEYQLDYVANQNPSIDAVQLADQTGAAIDPTAVPAGATITLTASWPVTETYLYFDPVSQALVTRRESMSVSWFVTAGSMPVDATDVGEDDLDQSASTTWIAPQTPGAMWMWIVLRDSRGGLATLTMPITVQ
jgi:hypothetical protein